MTDHKPCDPADPCATAYDLASERNTLDGLWAETKDRLDAALAEIAELRKALGTALTRAALAETTDTPAAPPASDGWTKWEGGECPLVGEALVSVRYRHSLYDAGGVAKNFHWRQFGGPNDIVAYRIVKEA